MNMKWRAERKSAIWLGTFSFSSAISGFQLWEQQKQLTLYVSDVSFFRQRVKAWANRGLHKWHPLTDRKWSALHRNPWDKKAVAKKREAQGLSVDRMDFSFHILNVYLFKPVLRVLTTKWHYIHFSNLQLFLGKNLLNFFYEFLL